MSGRLARGGRAALLAGGLVLLPVAAAQDGLIHPGDKKKPPPPPAPTAKHGAAFPDLAAFERMPSWKGPRGRLARAGLTDDGLAALEQELTVLHLNHGLTAKAGREAVGDSRPPGEPLGAEVSEDERLWLWQVPMVLDALEPLWNAAEWDAQQLAQAQAAARFFLREREDGPRPLTFVEGGHASNQAQLEQLVAWFRAEAAKPKRYALMLITDADGPWPLADAKAASKETETGELPLDAGRRLVLRHDAKGRGPWMLQLTAGKKAAWTKALAGVPADARLEFAGPLQSLGERGSLVTLDFGRTLDLYLDEKGQPLFYFLSW